MKSFLLVWNPEKHKWRDLQKAVEKVQNGEPYKKYWTCNKKAKIGDRFFLIRLKVAPKGIIGSGWIRSEPHLKPHFDDKKSLQVDIQFDCLSGDPIVSENELKSNFKGFAWFPQRAGVFIPDEISNKLKDFLDKRKASHSNEKSTSRIISEDEASRYPEGKPRYKVHRELERDTSITIKAKEQRLDLVGELKCDVCNFSFLERYGKLGGGFIEAHHTIPVSKLKGARKTTIKEIALVCSNCHKMLHTGERWLSVEELRKLIRKPMA